MAKFKKIANTNGQYLFWCEGCGYHHSVWTANEGYEHPIWNFNMDLGKPTVNPSINVRAPFPEGTRICHSFIKDGKIEYLSDCTHNLAGQTVELQDIE